MRIPLLVAVLLMPLAAHADRWIPYTDGRAGGCFQNDNGHLFGCTPQHNGSTRARESDLLERRDDSRVRDLERRTRELENQNRALQAERNRQNAIDQAQAAEDQRRSKALGDYYTSQRLREQAEQGRKREHQWLEARSGCNTPEYSEHLKKSGLKRHPSLQGVCIPAGHKPNSEVILAEACPPC